MVTKRTIVSSVREYRSLPQRLPETTKHLWHAKSKCFVLAHAVPSFFESSKQVVVALVAWLLAFASRRTSARPVQYEIMADWSLSESGLNAEPPRGRCSTRSWPTGACWNPGIMPITRPLSFTESEPVITTTAEPIFMDAVAVAMRHSPRPWRPRSRPPTPAAQLRPEDKSPKSHPTKCLPIGHTRKSQRETWLPANCL